LFGRKEDKISSVAFGDGKSADDLQSPTKMLYELRGGAHVLVCGRDVEERILNSTVHARDVIVDLKLAFYKHVWLLLVSDTHVQHC